MRIFIHQHQCPGDIVALTAAVRDLKAANPELHINVQTTQQELWNNNPNLNREVTEANADKVVTAECPHVHQSNTIRYHLAESFRLDLESKLGLKSSPGKLCADIHLSPEELAAPSQIADITGQDLKYWIIVSGVKSDITVKGWEFARFQQVVDALQGQITFVQVGEKGHGHYGLRNVIDLRGRTSPRQFVNLMYHASGVLCGITYPMHLATMQGRAGRILKNRPCIVIAGGREPVNWYAYENHHIIRRNGFMPCCDQGGCWKNHVTAPAAGDDRTCLHPVTSSSGQIIPRCMDTITVDEVMRAILLYIDGYKLFNLDFANPDFNLSEWLAAHPEYNAAHNGSDVPGRHIVKKLFAENRKN